MCTLVVGFGQFCSDHQPTFISYVHAKCHKNAMTGWWQLNYFFVCTPLWGRFPFWLIFFRWVETTNQRMSQKPWLLFLSAHKKTTQVFLQQCTQITIFFWWRFFFFFFSGVICWRISVFQLPAVDWRWEILFILLVESVSPKAAKELTSKKRLVCPGATMEQWQRSNPGYVHLCTLYIRYMILWIYMRGWDYTKSVVFRDYFISQ